MDVFQDIGQIGFSGDEGPVQQGAQRHGGGDSAPGQEGSGRHQVADAEQQHGTDHHRGHQQPVGEVIGADSGNHLQHHNHPAGSQGHRQQPQRDAQRQRGVERGELAEFRPDKGKEQHEDQRGHPEAPAPVYVVHQGPGDHGAEHRGQHPGDGEGGEEGRLFAGQNISSDHHIERHHQQAAADALDRATQHQKIDVRREGTQHQAAHE